MEGEEGGGKEMEKGKGRRRGKRQEKRRSGEREGRKGEGKGFAGPMSNYFLPACTAVKQSRKLQEDINH